MTESEGICSECKTPLLRLRWNEVTDVITCDNYDCGQFRTPIVPDETRRRVARTKREKTIIPIWTGGPCDSKADNFSDLLQGLRDKFPPQK